jgi:anaerobic selenocysteine-containing dehydrogenase
VEEPLAGVPNLSLRSERAPNGAGAAMLGYSTDWDGAVKAAAGAGLVLLLDVELTGAEAAKVAGAGAVVALGTTESQALDGAALVLPITNVAEEHGAFVNRDGRVQRYQQARSAPGMARPAWWIAAETTALLAPGADVPTTASEAFDAIADGVAALGGLSYAVLGLGGRVAAGGAGMLAGVAR